MKLMILLALALGAEAIPLSLLPPDDAAVTSSADIQDETQNSVTNMYSAGRHKRDGDEPEKQTKDEEPEPIFSPGPAAIGDTEEVGGNKGDILDRMPSAPPQYCKSDMQCDGIYQTEYGIQKLVQPTRETLNGITLKECEKKCNDKGKACDVIMYADWKQCDLLTGCDMKGTKNMYTPDLYYYEQKKTC